MNFKNLHCWALISIIAGFIGVFAHAELVPEREWESGWQELEKKDGIAVFSKSIIGSPAIAVRGTGNVDAPMEHVASVLMDFSKYSQWVDMVDDARYLHKDGDLKGVVYQHFSMPIVLKDRDIVLNVEGHLDSSGAFVLKTRSTEDPMAPPPNSVRTLQKWGFWVLTSVDGGKSTQVEVKALTDPNGSVPKWLVNSGSKDWPYKTLRALQKQVQKVRAPLPEVQALFKSVSIVKPVTSIQ